MSKLWTGLRYSGIFAKAALLAPVNSDASRRYILESLGSMPGLGAKAAQFLAMRLGTSEDGPPVRLEPLPLAWVKARIENSAPRLHRELSEISPAVQVASLGQVHLGRLASGQTVAIKVQFPDLKQGIEDHLGLIETLGKGGPPKKFQMEVAAIVSYFRESLLRELDYRVEAQQQLQARAALPPDKAICIAEVFPEYSSEHILVQSYEPGRSITQLCQEASHEVRQACAESLLDYFLSATFQARLLHTDPHPGNLGFRWPGAPEEAHRERPELVVYDFGSVMCLSQQDIAVLVGMIEALQSGKPFSALDAMVALGFDEKKLSPLEDRLPALVGKLLEPFCEEGPFSFRSWDLGAFFQKTLGEERWYFRSAGPPWFLMLMRAAQGVIHSFTEMGCRLPVRQSFEALALTRERPFEGLQATRAERQSDVFPRVQLARRLRIQVRNTFGEELVDMELPARAIDELEYLMPPDALTRLQEQGLEIDSMRDRVYKSGFAVQTIFERSTGEKVYKIELIA